MIEEGEIGLSVSQAEFSLALERITKLEGDIAKVQEQLNNMGVTPEEIQILLNSLNGVNEKINTLESYDKNSTQAFTAVMNRLTTIEMNHLRLGANELNIPVTLTENIVLPAQDEYMNEIAWLSSDEDIISNDGTVVRPAASSGDAQVILTATLTAGANTIEKVFTVTVKALEQTDAEKLAIVIHDLDSSIFIGIVNDQGFIEVTENQTLPTTLEEATITWQSSNEGAIALDGTVTRSADSNQDVTLTALVVLGEASEQVIFNLVVLQLEQEPTEPEPPVTEPTDPEVGETPTEPEPPITDPETEGETTNPEIPETGDGEGMVDPVEPPVTENPDTEIPIEPTEPVEGETPPAETEEIEPTTPENDTETTPTP